MTRHYLPLFCKVCGMVLLISFRTWPDGMGNNPDALVVAFEDGLQVGNLRGSAPHY